jgi:hypothetical protein
MFYKGLGWRLGYSIALTINCVELEVHVAEQGELEKKYIVDI